jgi:hypothetical protein
MELGKGLTHPAKFEDIIEDIFQNEKMKNANDSKVKFIFAEAYLTAPQKASLIYPIGFTPIDAYIIYVVNNYSPLDDDVPTSSTASLVSFVKKADDFIYGYYFDVTGAVFDAEVLEKSKEPIVVPLTAVITPSNYSELYTKVNHTVVALGLSTDPIETNIQYSHDSKYYYTNVGVNGITDLTIPKTELEGLSHSLKHLKERDFD